MQSNQDASAAASIQCAIADLYERYLVPAAQMTDTPLDYVPNRKFTILLAGPISAGKSSFVNYFVGQDLQKVGRSSTTDKITFIIPGYQRATFNYSHGKQFLPSLAAVFDKYCPEDALESVVEVYRNQPMSPPDNEILSALSRTFDVGDEKLPAPFLFVDSPGFGGDCSAKLTRALQVIAHQVDCIVVFADQFSPMQVFDFISYLYQEKLQTKLLVVKSKLDELDKPLDFIDGLVDAAQAIAKNTMVSTKIYPIALPTFIRSLRAKMAEEAMKTKLSEEIAQKQEAPERSRVSFAPEQSDLIRTDVNQTIAHKDLNIESQICVPDALNQLDALETKIYDHLNSSFQKAVTAFDKDVPAIYDKLQVIAMNQLNKKSAACRSAVFAVLLFTAFVFVVIMFALQVASQRLHVKFPPIVSQLFGINGKYTNTRHGKITLLTTAGMMLISAALFTKGSKKVDTAEIAQWLLEFQEKLMSKVGALK